MSRTLNLIKKNCGIVSLTILSHNGCQIKIHIDIFWISRFGQDGIDPGSIQGCPIVIKYIGETFQSWNALTGQVGNVSVSDKQAMAGAAGRGEVGADNPALQTSPG